MKYLKSKIKQLFNIILRNTPYFNIMFYTKNLSTPITWKMWFFQKILGFNRKAYFPIHFTSRVVGVQNICAGIETCPGYMPGCYIQGGGKIYIGDYTQIGPKVGIISSNHDIYDSKKSHKGEVNIGKYCWLGMDSIILPNVTLGDFTIVGAGSVVTKSFEEGYCLIAGNPAKVVKYLDKSKCEEKESDYKYNGYIKHENFEKYRKKNLKV